MHNKDGISVIVCCYNSAGRLPQTIKHLAAQTFAKEWEIVLVNNNATDNTAETAQKEWDKYQLPNTVFKVIDQLKPGLNYAREKGVEYARFEYIIFCDDDNWLNADYLAIAYNLFKGNAHIGAAGGVCIAEPENGQPLPDWFEANKNNYAVGKQADVSGDITARGYLWGAGLITTKTIFNTCVNASYPYLLTDRMGNLLSSGGDAELCSRIILCGYRLYYDEGLTLKHFIPVSRLTSSYLNALIKAIDASGEQISLYKSFIYLNSLTKAQRIENALKCAAKIILSAISKKWDVKQEKRALQIYSGINWGIDSNLKLIKKFNNAFIRPHS